MMMSNYKLAIVAGNCCLSMGLMEPKGPIAFFMRLDRCIPFRKEMGMSGCHLLHKQTIFNQKKAIK